MVWEPSLKEHVCGQCQFHTGLIIMNDYSGKHTVKVRFMTRYSSLDYAFAKLSFDQDFVLCL